MAPNRHPPLLGDIPFLVWARTIRQGRRVSCRGAGSSPGKGKGRTADRFSAMKYGEASKRPDIHIHECNALLFVGFFGRPIVHSTGVCGQTHLPSNRSIFRQKLPSFHFHLFTYALLQSPPPGQGTINVLFLENTTSCHCSKPGPYVISLILSSVQQCLLDGGIYLTLAGWLMGFPRRLYT